jgi:Ca-activated chloride channel family protein
MLNNWNIRFWEYEYFAPGYLWLLTAIPFVWIVLYFYERKRRGDVKYSLTSEDQRQLSTGWVFYLRQIYILSYGVIAALLILALAKPFHWSNYEDTDRNYKEGIDIILAMDVSLSMLARDFEPNRLEAAKKVATEFVDGRHGDRIGLVVYAGEAYTACPATLDYAVLKDQISKINGDRIEGGTAIGTGLGTAVARLRNDSIPSKIVILLTDGSNNSGNLEPEAAAELARAKNVRVYTIGMGTDGEASVPIVGPFGVHYDQQMVEIDEGTLMRIADITGGKFFRAKDEEGLKKIYEEIERMEKRKMEDLHFHSDPPPNPRGFLNWAFALIVLTWGSHFIVFRYHG